MSHVKQPDMATSVDLSVQGHSPWLCGPRYGAHHLYADSERRMLVCRTCGQPFEERGFLLRFWTACWRGEWRPQWPFVWRRS